MQLTEEQKRIHPDAGNLRVIAVAGSGKTTALINYARHCDRAARILYLAFNRTVRREGQEKFSAAGLSNVTVQTAHSLAYAEIIYRGGYILGHHSAGMLLQRFFDGADHLDETDALALAGHLNEYIRLFCSSTCRRVEEVDYLGQITDEQTRDFVKAHFPALTLAVRRVLSAMKLKYLPVTHDFYLKLYQLQEPRLAYDYILFDEGQDASPVMLDIIQRQEHAVRVIAGDPHQQIYAWRNAVNAMHRFSFPPYNLTRSFRFNHAIGRCARAVIRLKRHIGRDHTVQIRAENRRTPERSKKRAVLGRSNISLLAEAVTLLSREPGIRIRFEGGLGTYMFSGEEGALSDVLNIFNQKYEMVRNERLRHFQDLSGLASFAEKCGDRRLAQTVDLVKEHGAQLPARIAALWKANISADENVAGAYVFSTVHRCKGLEYDEVYLCSDFITEKEILRRKKEGLDDGELERIEEEINLLYVAVTRARHRVVLHADALPAGMSQNTAVMTHERLSEMPGPGETSAMNAGRPWTGREDARCLRLYGRGKPPGRIARSLGRSRGAVISRLRRFQEEGLID
ncbi:MAG: UvrD-helicase domain-containing protein [Fibrobacterota bacterium]